MMPDINFESHRVFMAISAKLDSLQSFPYSIAIKYFFEEYKDKIWYCDHNGQPGYCSDCKRIVK